MTTTISTTETELRTGMRMSVEEFLDIGETDGTWELDDGVLYIVSSANADHQFVQGELIRKFGDYIDGFEEPPAVMFHDFTTVLSRALGRAPEPDLVIVLADRAGIVRRNRIEGVPDIVVEILSTNRSRDLTRKRQVHAEAGIPEYLIFDLANDTVLPLELRGGVYTERPMLTADDVLTTPLLPGLEIPLADIFRHRRRPARDAG